MGTRVIRRTKNHIGIIILVCVLVVAGAVGGFLYYKEVTTPKLAQISIDDATMILKDITLNEYDSIFENPILGKLKTLHDEYGITGTLYVFEQMDGFAIWDMPTDYKKEFVRNADWLKFGYHSATEENPADVQTEADFETEFDRTESAIWRFAGGDSVSHVLRLHYWYASDDMVDYMKEKGITGLLCMDAEKASYNLTPEQTEKLYKSRDGKLSVDDMTYYATDIRLENTHDVAVTLEEKKKDKVLVIFTHAWCFDENYEKLREIVTMLSETGYQFSTLDVGNK